MLETGDSKKERDGSVEMVVDSKEEWLGFFEIAVVGSYSKK